MKRQNRLVISSAGTGRLHIASQLQMVETGSHYPTSHASIKLGQNFHTILCHQQRVLVLRTQAPVFCHHRPLVRPH